MNRLVKHIVIIGNLLADVFRHHSKHHCIEPKDPIKTYPNLILFEGEYLVRDFASPMLKPEGGESIPVYVKYKGDNP